MSSSVIRSTSVSRKRSAPQVLEKATILSTPLRRLRNAPSPGFGSTPIVRCSHVLVLLLGAACAHPPNASHASRIRARGGRIAWSEAIGHRGFA